MADSDEIDVAALVREKGAEAAEEHLLALGVDGRSAAEMVALAAGEAEGQVKI